MKTILILITVSMLAGCSTIKSITNRAPDNRPQALLSSWYGQPLIKLEKHPEFGIPTEKSNISDGSIAYIYLFNGSIHTGYAAFGNMATASTSQVQCMFTFYTKNNVITDANMRGNCRIDASRLPQDD